MTRSNSARRRCEIQFDARKIDALCADLDQGHLPGVAVGIALDGVPVYRKGFGLASIELPVVLSPSIRMRIGSTTKHFTAFTWMLLCEEGRAGIDDPVGTHLPEIHPVARQVTMRQLMGNLSGLRDATDLTQQFSGVGRRLVSAQDLLSIYRDVEDVNAAPGSTFIYNNGGWVMLSAAIERVSGQSLEEAMWTRVFQPIGMHDTAVRRWDFQMMANSASTHSLNPAGGYERDEYCGGIDYAGAGAIVSTIDDMLRWLAHMDEPTIGSAATWAMMKTPQLLTNGTSSDYGLGLFTGQHRGFETLYHSGGGNGSNAQMLKVPSAGLDIVLLGNRSDLSSVALGDKILDACLPVAESTAEAVGARTAVQGVFRSPSTSRVVQLFVRNAEQVMSVDGFDMPCAADAERVLRPVGPFTAWKMAVTLEGNGAEPESIRLSEFGNADRLFPQRVREPEGSKIIGRYRAATAGVVATVTMNEAGLRLQTETRLGLAAFELNYLADGIWRANASHPQVKPPAAVVAFDAESAAFRFSNILTRNLRFERVD
jgi:CubicO group peptidase (beta-lactamase class C family)